MAKNSTSFKKGHKTNVGRHWKVKDTSKMSLVHIGHKPTLKQLEGLKFGRRKGKRHYKIADTSKMSEARMGEKNPNWQGGISFEPYSIDWTETLKRSIRERDHYICQLCQELQGDRALSIHHIDYCKTNNNPNNLIALCNKCHLKTNINRNYWINYFYAENL